VIVVGAGAAGITAAARLQEAGVNHIILESTSRIGGRIRKHKFGKGGPNGDGWVIEDGAMWLEDTEDEEPWTLAQASNFRMAQQKWKYKKSAYDESVSF
jgi:monoamine oxidase